MGAADSLTDVPGQLVQLCLVSTDQNDVQVLGCELGNIKDGVRETEAGWSKTGRGRIE